MLKLVKELSNVMIYVHEDQVLLVPLDDNDFVYVLKDLEADLFKITYNNKSSKEDWKKYILKHGYDENELMEFHNKILEKLVAQNLIGLHAG